MKKNVKGKNIYNKNNTTSFIDTNKPLKLNDLGFKLQEEEPIKKGIEKKLIKQIHTL